MKAVRYHAYGDTDVLLYEDVDHPVPGPGQVRVQVAGAAFNPVDDAIRGGLPAAGVPGDLPAHPEHRRGRRRRRGSARA